MEIWATVYVIGFLAMVVTVSRTPGALDGLKHDKLRVKLSMGIIVFTLALVWPLTLLGAFLGSNIGKKV